MVRLLVTGLSYKSAPLDVREAFAASGDALTALVQRMGEDPEVAEIMLLSTCNRVELYVVPCQPAGSSPERAAGHKRASEGAPAGRATMDRLFARGRGLDPALLGKYGYFEEGMAAVRHLLRVTASLDSMVVGEPQIQGQVKEAARVARQAGTLGPVLEQLLQRAFRAAKAVRTQTAIAEQRVSIASVAVDLARRIFVKISNLKVLLVGAGEMGEATARSLASAGAARVYICNRSRERALRLAEEHGWRARGFDELEDLLAEADIVLTSTGATRPIITPKLIKRVIRARKYRPLFFVDIAVPRDVDPAVGRMDTVYLYNVDDLESVSRENLRARQREAVAAEALVDRELADLGQWFRLLEVTPTLAAIRERADDVAAYELDRSLAGRLRHLPTEDREAVAVALRASAQGQAPASLVPAARRLLGLDDFTPREIRNRARRPSPAPPPNVEPGADVAAAPCTGPPVGPHTGPAAAPPPAKESLA